MRTNCRAADGSPIATGGPGCSAPLAYQLTHPTPWWDFNHVFGPLVLMVLIVLPLLTVAFVEYRLFRARR